MLIITIIKYSKISDQMWRPHLRQIMEVRRMYICKSSGRYTIFYIYFIFYIYMNSQRDRKLNTFLDTVPLLSRSKILNATSSRSLCSPGQKFPLFN